MSEINPRYIHAIFCDDVRHEVGGKLSLMGIYQGSMNLTVQTLPVVLPRICAVITATTPIVEPFEKLEIKVLYGETVLSESVTPVEELSNTNMPPKSDLEKYNIHGTVFMMHPFVVERSDILRVRAYTERGEVKVGGIQINITQVDQSPT